MHIRRFLVLLLCCSPLLLQAQKQPVALPEVNFVKPAKDHYIWEKVGQIKGRRLLGNSIAVVDSVVYSFGGYIPIDSLGFWTTRGMLNQEMNVISDGKLIRDSIQYPGRGFYYNVFFHSGQSLYIGGGRDSGAARYAESDFWRYDLKSRSWSRLQDIPFYYARPLFIVPNDSGALILAATLKGEDFRESAPALLQYNSKNDTWTVKSRILKATDLTVVPPEGYIYGHADLATFRIENDLYVLLIGARGFGVYSPVSFFKLGMNDGIWTPLPPFPGSTRDFCFAFSDGMYGFVGGGMSYLGTNSRVAYRYDPRREEWTRIEDLPIGLRRSVGWNFKGENFLGFGLADETDRILIYKLKQKMPKGKKAKDHR